VATVRANDKAGGALDDPNEGEDGESESRPVNKARGSLVSEDGPKRPGNSDGGRKIAFGGREGISGGCALEEEASDKKVEDRVEEKDEKILTEQGRQRLLSRRLHHG